MWGDVGMVVVVVVVVVVECEWPQFQGDISRAVLRTKAEHSNNCSSPDVSSKYCQDQRLRCVFGSLVNQKPDKKTIISDLRATGLINVQLGYRATVKLNDTKAQTSMSTATSEPRWGETLELW